MERAIKDLCRLSDAAFFSAVAEGLGHIVKNVERLAQSALILSENEHEHPARIMGQLAAEESAKVLILLDAVRCPLDKRPEKSRTLGYFYSHLAKGIYVEICGLRPTDFSRLSEYIERERVEYYLDGPNGVDWIFPNAITQQREDDLYVGYFRDDSEQAGVGSCYWTSPYNDLLRYRPPEIISVVQSLHVAGMTLPDALSTIADFWRIATIDNATTLTQLRNLNGCTLERLSEQGQLSTAQQADYDKVRLFWPFPLWSLDLRLKEVDKEDLRYVRRMWVPEDWK